MMWRTILRYWVENDASVSSGVIRLAAGNGVAGFLGGSRIAARCVVGWGLAG